MAKALALRIMERVNSQAGVSIDYLAFELGSTRAEILERLSSLAKSGVVQISGDTVKKVKSDDENRHKGPHVGTAA